MKQTKSPDVQAFLEYKASIKRAFREACRHLYGDPGCGKLADAAWYIATNAPICHRYLQGDLIGNNSYQWLMLALADAFVIARKLNDIKAAYHSGGVKEPAPK